MPTPAKSSTEGGSEPLPDQHQTVSGEQIFGHNNQIQVKQSSSHFTNVTEVFVKESYEKKPMTYWIVVEFEKSQPADIICFSNCIQKEFLMIKLSHHPNWLHKRLWQIINRQAAVYALHRIYCAAFCTTVNWKSQLPAQHCTLPRKKTSTSLYKITIFPAAILLIINKAINKHSHPISSMKCKGMGITGDYNLNILFNSRDWYDDLIYKRSLSMYCTEVLCRASVSILDNFW